MSEETKAEIQNWLRGRGYGPKQVAEVEDMLECLWQEITEIRDILAG